MHNQRENLSDRLLEFAANTIQLCEKLNLKFAFCNLQYAFASMSNLTLLPNSFTFSSRNIEESANW